MCASVSGDGIHFLQSSHNWWFRQILAALKWRCGTMWRKTIQLRERDCRWNAEMNMNSMKWGLKWWKCKKCNELGKEGGFNYPSAHPLSLCLSHSFLFILLRSSIHWHCSPPLCSWNDITATLPPLLLLFLLSGHPSPVRWDYFGMTGSSMGHREV